MTTRRPARAATLLLLVLGCLAPAPAAQEGPRRTQPWEPDVVDLYRTIPVQDDGRIKPLDTAVSFLLLRMNGKRSVTIPDEERFGPLAGERLTPMEWALDCLFYPAQAADYPVFQIQTSEVLTAMGVAHEGRSRRGRYSFNDLLPGGHELQRLSRDFSAIEEKERSVVEAQVVALGVNFFHYSLFVQTLDFARTHVSVDGTPELAALFPRGPVAEFSEVLARGAEVSELYRAGFEADGHGGAASKAVEQVILEVGRLGEGGRFLSWLPPSNPEVDQWMRLQDLVLLTVMQPSPLDHDAHLAALGHAEVAMHALGDNQAFRAASVRLHDTLVKLAADRGEYAKVEREVAFYKADYFSKALVGFLIAFVLAAVSWMRPRGRWLGRAVAAAVAIPTGYLVWGIVERCILRGRPPVTTLYETVLFITATLVLVSLFMEWINRKKIALSAGALLGAVGMFLAFSYERTDGQDTMPTLLAVLDTNFWLATHVTCITVGYAAGLLAGAIAHVYLLGKLFGLKRGDNAFYASVARMVYGVVCFTLVFSVVGTILGGIWANDSWGRFWGWDPKENGALLICLWYIAILHARMGGLIRQFGLCLAAVFGNVVVAFSWWGVNLLGVGLHSYGFTAGIQRVLYSFYGLQGLVLALGAIAWWRASRSAATARAAQAAPVQSSPPARTPTAPPTPTSSVAP